MAYHTAFTTVVIPFLYWLHSFRSMHLFIYSSLFMPEISSPGLRYSPLKTIDSRNWTLSNSA